MCKHIAVFSAVLVMIFCIAGHSAFAQATPEKKADVAQSLSDLQKTMTELNKSITAQMQEAKNVQRDGMEGMLPMVEAQLQTPAPAISNVDGFTEGSMPQMAYAYMIIETYLKGGKGETKRLKEVCFADRKLCMFLTEFWRVRAFDACQGTSEYIVRELISNAENKEEALMYKGMIDQCYNGFYYEHWDEIGESIKSARAQLQKEQKK